MAGQNLPAVLSRRRPAPTGDEEATAILKLGDMTDVPALSVAECNELLRTIADRGGRPTPNNDVYVKTREYLKIFSRFQERTAVTQVDAISRRIMEFPGATHFERAQLATLCCDTAEEARTLIPSLEGKISDDELQQILDDISKLRDFS